MLSLQINFKLLKSKFKLYTISHTPGKYSALSSTNSECLRNKKNIVTITKIVCVNNIQEKMNSSVHHSYTNKHPVTFLTEWIIGFLKRSQSHYRTRGGEGEACRGVGMFDIQLCISNDFSFIFYFTVAMVYFR